MKATVTLLFLCLSLFLLREPVSGQENPAGLFVTEYPREARYRDSVAAMRIPELLLPPELRNRQIPPSIDNSRKICWPGIQDQYQFYTCQQYAGVTYVFGYEINRLRNKPGWYWENMYPAHYTWNFMNEGGRYVGVNFLQSFDLIRSQGHMTMHDYGFDTLTSVLGWQSGYDRYYRGMLNRIKSVRAIVVNGEDGVNTLRNYLYDHLDGSSTGGVACFTTSSFSLVGMVVLPAGTPLAGHHLVTRWDKDPVHGLAVVGYNDSIRYDINEDGQYTRHLDITGDGIVDMRDWETGGFRIANSYGNWWADTGYCYALYRSFALNYGEGGIWNNRVYVVEADTGYRPLLTLKAVISHNSRDRIRLMAGINPDTNGTMPTYVMDFPVFHHQGGNHPMQGYDSLPGADTLELGLDVTELLNHAVPGTPARYFLLVGETDPERIGSGSIVSASFIGYHGAGTEASIEETGVAIRDNAITTVSAVGQFSRPDVTITTEELPPLQGQALLQVQLSAAGGTLPYTWSLPGDYLEKPVGTAMPQAGGPSLYQFNETRPFATVPLPFHFPFYGHEYDTVYANFYGFLTFMPENLPAPYITDEASMLKMFPLIAPAFSQQWAYLFTDNDGLWVESDSTRVVIRWKVSVAPYYTTTEAEFALILYPDGRFETCYGDMHMTGISHTFHRGFSKGDGVNCAVTTQWDATEVANTAVMYVPPVMPEGITLAESGLLTVSGADSSLIYGIRVRVEDGQRISDTRTLTLSGGLAAEHELICGDDGLFSEADTASLALRLKNTSAGSWQDLRLTLSSLDPGIQVDDSIRLAGQLQPGMSLEIDNAFLFRTVGGMPDNYPASLSLIIRSGDRTWRKDLVVRVAAPAIGLEEPAVDDGFNHMLDPGEVADLDLTLFNAGSVSSGVLEVNLQPLDALVTVLSPAGTEAGEIPASGSVKVRYRVMASREALAGSTAAMKVTVTGIDGTHVVREFALTLGESPVAIVSLSASHASARAMARALDSLRVGYDTIFSVPFNINHYSSVFLILGTGTTGSYVLSEEEGQFFAGYLQRGGRLYTESYYLWYYQNENPLIPWFGLSAPKVPAWFFADVLGLQGTFADSMSFVCTSPLNYAIYHLEPILPAYPALAGPGSPARNLLVANPGELYRTIGTMAGFSSLAGVEPATTPEALMKAYLGFFELNVDGPFPLFHAGSSTVCAGQAVDFHDDSFNDILTRSWEFPGGTPATSSEANPVVVYPDAGLYSVRLTVSDGKRSESILKKDFIHVTDCAGLPKRESETGVLVFPNPAREILVVRPLGLSLRTLSVTIRNAWGKTVREFRELPNSINGCVVPVADLPGGFYIVRVTSGDWSAVAKFIRN